MMMMMMIMMMKFKSDKAAVFVTMLHVFDRFLSQVACIQSRGISNFSDLAAEYFYVILAVS